MILYLIECLNLGALVILNYLTVKQVWRCLLHFFYSLFWPILIKELGHTNQLVSLLEDGPGSHLVAKRTQQWEEL